MASVKALFNFIIFQPLYNALIALYVIIPDFGIAIILLTIAIKLLLIPVSKKSIESQKKMQEIQPELKKLQEKYKHDKQLQGQKIMEFYKKKDMNPASGCLPMIIQLIVLIALYRVFMLGLDSDGAADLIYSFAKNPGTLNPISLGFINLGEPNMILAVIAAGLQFVQAKMMINKSKKNEQKQEKKSEEEPDFSAIMQKQLLYLGPVMTLVIGFSFPSGLIVYWIVSTLFMIIQQYLVLEGEKKKNNTKKVTTIEP